MRRPANSSTFETVSPAPGGSISFAPAATSRRQDNEADEADADAPEYWLQTWRSGPGDEVVLVGAYVVGADGTCSPLVHIVYRFDRDTGRITSTAYGANGLSGRGDVSFDGAVTTSEVTIRLPDGRTVRMRDREDRDADAVVVRPETWNGQAWVQGESATWRYTSQDSPCR